MQIKKYKFIRQYQVTVITKETYIKTRRNYLHLVDKNKT